MKKRLLFTLLIMGVAFAGFAEALVITGKWGGTVDFGNGEMPITYNLTADGAKLTGTVEASGSSYTITDGQVKGDSLLFNVDYNGTPIPNKAKCYADSIGVNLDVQGQVFHILLKHAK